MPKRMCLRHLAGWVSGIWVRLLTAEDKVNGADQAQSRP